MSKAFTKETDDDLEDLLQIQDAALPPGEKNYVTPAGAARLRADIQRLREAPRGDARRRIRVEERLAGLLRRLEAAEIIDPTGQPADRVRFGATVTVRGPDGGERRHRIVGVDEADPRRGLISWRTPVARALTGLRVGDVATVRTPGGDEELEVERIEYLPD
jgi:transcription elongation factor GreB